MNYTSKFSIEVINIQIRQDKGGFFLSKDMAKMANLFEKVLAGGRGGGGQEKFPEGPKKWKGKMGKL